MAECGPVMDSNEYLVRAFLEDDFLLNDTQVCAGGGEESGAISPGTVYRGISSDSTSKSTQGQAFRLPPNTDKVKQLAEKLKEVARGYDGKGILSQAAETMVLKAGPEGNIEYSLFRSAVAFAESPNTSQKVASMLGSVKSAINEAREALTLEEFPNFKESVISNAKRFIEEVGGFGELMTNASG